MNTTDIRHDAQAETIEQDGFEVDERASETLEVIELENAPLTDINFGF